MTRARAPRQVERGAAEEARQALVARLAALGADADATRAELATAQACPTVLSAKCQNRSRIVTRARAPRQAAAAVGAEQLAAAEEELRRLNTSLVLPQVCIVCRMT